MNDMPPEAQALMFGLGAATVIAIVLLVFGERPKLAAAVRAWIGGARVVPVRAVMSNGDAADNVFAPEEAAESPAQPIAQDENNGIADSTTERNALLFMARADVLAQFVAAGKIGETDGIRIVFGVGPSSTNKTYLAARELLRARLARLQAPQPGTPKPLTAEQHATRAALGLLNKAK